MNLPLAGYTVLDLSQVIAGPETAMLLGELGANVIKVEKPGGEDSRNMGAAASGMSRTFSMLNRNKRSIELDLSKPEGKAVLYRLAAQADILVEGFIPGAADRMGIGFAELSSRNPRLVYATISGFGTAGPYADKPAYDLVLQGMSGVMGARRWPDGTPIPAPLWVGDASAPFMLLMGIFLALMEREKTGRGQKVEASLLLAQIAMQGTQLIRVKGEEKAEDLGSASFQPYRCGDGEFINVTILNERQWQGFSRVLGVEHLGADPNYNTVDKRVVRRDELFNLIGGILETKAAAEWLALLQAAGVPCGPVVARADVFDLPQVTANHMFVEREQVGLGTVQEMNFPLRFSSIETAIQRPAPLCGQHTAEVLAEFGFSGVEIEALRGAGALGKGGPPPLSSSDR